MDNTKTKEIISETKWLLQNQKILRYRSSLAHLAVVCVHIRNINGELLSVHFCNFIKINVLKLNNFHEVIHEEISRQSSSNIISKEKKSRIDTYSTTSSRQLINQRYAPLRTRLLGTLHNFCENLLSELHQINYEYISDVTFKTFGDLIDFFVNFKNEIQKELLSQNQNKNIIKNKIAS